VTGRVLVRAKQVKQKERDEEVLAVSMSEMAGSANLPRNTGQK